MSNNSNGNGHIKVAIYSRVSTSEQVEGTSMEFQQSQMESACQLQGLEIAQIYSDPGFTGKDDNRPGLQRMLSDAKLGLFDRIMILKLDRLARNLRLLLQIEEQLKEEGVSLSSVKENIDTSTPIGRTVFQVLGLVAEWERDTIVQRTSEGRLQRYRQGCWAGGKPPYGYSYDPKTKKLIINSDEARIVKRIYSEYDSGGTLYSISTQFNTEKIPARKSTGKRQGKGWRPTALRQVMLNPVYKGTLIANRHAQIAIINKIDLSKTITIPVPPLVDEAVWQRAQERLKNNKHNRPTKRGEFLLQGVITCGTCGYHYASDRIHGVRYYVCRGEMKSKHIDGSPRCKSRAIKADQLENQVWNRIEGIILDRDKLTTIIQDTIESLRVRETDLNARIKPISSRLAEIADQKARLADEWVARYIKAERFKELKSQLDEEEDRLQALKANIDPAQIAELEDIQKSLCSYQSQIKELPWVTEDEEAFHLARSADGPHQTILRKAESSNSEKRDWIDKFRVKLVVLDDKIHIESLFPIEPINKHLCSSTED